MFGKIIVNACIEVLTGLHIGGSVSFSAIGAVDSPVIRDAKTGLPFIPGSSLKGKIRALLVRSMSDTLIPNNEPDEDAIEIKRLFGGDKGKIRSRFQFVDAYLMNENEMGETGFTEIKFENTINRLTGVANPRQIERVIQGTKFAFTVVYNIFNEKEIIEDFTNFTNALKLLQLDYLGGNGTRGYGRIRFLDFSINEAGYSLLENDREEILKLLKGVEENELLHIPAEV